MLLPVILIAIKLLLQVNILKHIERKHGQQILQNVRILERLEGKLCKINKDIKFIQLCKTEHLISTFAKVKLAIKSRNAKLQQKLARIIMETEMQQKHLEKRKIRREIVKLSLVFKDSLGLILFNVIMYRLDRSLKLKSNVVSERHIKKLSKLRNQTNSASVENSAIFTRQTVHNFSSYHLTMEEEKALSFGLDEQIPTGLNRNKLFTEFEIFNQSILNDLPNLPEQDTMALKTKLRHTCEKYSQIKVPYKYLTVINNLRRNKDLVILKQDKGKGVVLLDRTVYIEKCLSVLNTQQFQQLDISPTAANEHKIQRVLRKIKSKLTQQEYNRLYPTGSNAGKFYGSAKLHKLPTFGTVDQLPLRPIISNIGTASYQLAKHLAKLLLPLSKNQCTINSTKSFMSFIKHRKVPDGHKMVSFDVVSLFTNVPLDAAIEIILKRIHGNNEINTPITKMEMKELILLCTKGVHFTFDGKTYVQTNGVAMGSPLVPVLLGILMVELEKNLIHTLSEHLSCWKRYVDDTI